MAIEIHTLTLPVHPLQLEARAAPDWHGQWQARSNIFVQALGPRRGVHRITFEHDSGRVTVEYDPRRFSLEQLQALGREMGLAIGGAVIHAALDLPRCGRRAAMAADLEARLQRLPGVAHAAVNPQARTLVVEYVSPAAFNAAQLARQLQAWGYHARDLRLPSDWWQRNRALVYTLLTGAGLLAAWLAQRLGAPAWAWGALAALAYLAGGGSATWSALGALRRGQIDVDFLMVSAALGAAVIGDWVEGGILLFLFSLSNALQGLAMDRTRQAIRALMALRPATARLRRGGAEVEVPVETLSPGDRVIVHPGERLPADGEVIAGQSAVDQAPITGESIPVWREPGGAVFAGSINGDGALEVRVTRAAKDSTLARVILLVEEAQSERAPTQRRLDEMEQRYAAGVIGLAALTALGLPLAFGWAWPEAFYKAMTLLVVASPCALVISTPASILSAIAAGARHGVLFKGGMHLESLAGVRVVAFDKTGTLTTGRPRVTRLWVPGEGPQAAAQEAELLGLAAAVEIRSGHPLARAVVAAAQERGLSLPQAGDMQAAPGRGVTARVDGCVVHVGNEGYLQEHGVRLAPEPRAVLDAWEQQGQTVMLVGQTCDGQGVLTGLIAAADSVRPESRAAVASLKAAGVQKVVMLTGDHAVAARAIGAQAGVDEVRAELLPEDKVAEVRRLMREHGAVAMVGDGVNDAPALAAATVGIAMGAGGTDVALETADVVLMASDLSKLPYAVQLSRDGMRVVWQNLAFSLAVIFALISSAFLNVISLPLGVVGHEGSTVLVVLNGLRLLGRRPR